MTILVTGGLGFVGSNIVRSLNRRGIHDIILVDSKMNGLSNVQDCKYSDLIDKESLKDRLDDLTALKVIFHQGAITDTTFFDEKEMMKVNFDLSVMLYDFCVNNKVRMLYASSAAVYGQGSNGFLENESCEFPLNIYAKSKLKFDNYVRNTKNKPKQIVGLRYFNVYGPGENHKLHMASPINQFFFQAKKEGHIKVFKGSNKFYRDFISVKDVVDVNMFFFDNPEKSGILNCGTGETASFQDAAMIVSKQLSVPILEVEFPKVLKGKYQSYTCSNNENLRLAGYQKKFCDFEDEAANYVQYLNAK